MSAAQQDILRYLPHRPPFVMIDELVAEEGGPARSRFKILAENVLVADGYFSESGLIENMAQTAGAATGFNAQATGNAPALGYIGAVKELKVFALPRIGQTLDTEIIFVQQVMQALIVRGAVHCDGQLLATCELKIFLQS
jgi:predicted hotdog family 3-hydroxylacyl-ACP dehydratase